MWEISGRRRHSTLWVSYDTETRRAAYTVTANYANPREPWCRNAVQPNRNANQCASSMRAAFAEFAADQRREREYAQQARDFND